MIWSNVQYVRVDQISQWSQLIADCDFVSVPAWLSVCPQLGSDFYCCRGFDKDAYSGRRSNMAGDFGEQCLPFSVLQGKPFFPL